MGVVGRLEGLHCKVGDATRRWSICEVAGISPGSCLGLGPACR